MSFGNAGAANAAAALIGIGPYTARLGILVDPAGVGGEPTPGVGGYSRPTVTLDRTGRQITISSAITLGPASANLGALRAISVHDASGNCLICDSLDDSITLNVGETRVFPAGTFVFTVKVAGE